MALSPQEILALVPQQRPMRFIDKILEVDEEHILATYTWKQEDCEGHFPGNPVVPGVKLIEMSAQVGNVAWGIYHLSLQSAPEELKGKVGLFGEIEHGVFKKVVRPHERVIAQATFGDDGYFRAGKIVSYVEIQFDGGPKDGQEIFSGKTSGLWVAKEAAL